ncbi:3-ketoacyl-CoA thiolase 2, peroxisomal-like protein [Tanacetum coccineum]
MMKTRGARVSPFSTKDDGSPPSSSVPNYMNPTVSTMAKARPTTLVPFHTKQQVKEAVLVYRDMSMDYAISCLESITPNFKAWDRGLLTQEYALSLLPWIEVDSHRKVAAATASGKFKDEIILVKIKERIVIYIMNYDLNVHLEKIVDPKTRDKTPTIFVDEVTRPGINLADLAKLKPVFKKDFEPGE